MKKISKMMIVLSTDDIKDHRYKSIDDWFDPDVSNASKGNKNEKALLFATLTADTGNMDYNFLILMHALVEQYLCYKHGIKDAEVTGFDMDHPELDDPGNDPKAPYHKEHMVANDIEATLSVALGADWGKYEDAIDKTLKKWKPKK